MIYTWYEFYQELSLFALTCLVDLGDNVHQYGSWKDIKYFCNFVLNKTLTKDHALIQFGIKLINNQLREDESNYNINQSTLIIPEGIQIRIPSNYSNIISNTLLI